MKARPGTLTRASLNDLATCARRFWLRYRAGIPWPAPPRPRDLQESMKRGQEFHKIMQRHFLGLAPEIVPPELDPWWNAWQDHPVPLLPGERLPEVTLSVPLEGARLLARFDLLVLAQDGRALILDWKTDRHPRSRAQLAADIQTLLYPFVLAEGGTALAVPAGVGSPRAGVAARSPQQIEMVYWQANDPANPIRFPYSAETHDHSRDVLRALVTQAKALRPEVEPAVIDDLTVCARCVYRTYCGRELPGTPGFDWEADLEPPVELEPSR